jgi:hypothetical protein
MQRNSVISLRPALGMRRTPRDVTGADPGALYGCVDWYLYHEVTASACSSRPARSEAGRMSEPGAVLQADTAAHASR